MRSRSAEPCCKDNAKLREMFAEGAKKLRIFAACRYNAVYFVAMRIIALLRENLSISISSIKATKLRTGLTVSIIALGIMALVGILTATEVISTSLTDEFTAMGANSFAINRIRNVAQGKRSVRTRTHMHISQRQAAEFKERYTFAASVGLSAYASGGATVKYKSAHTNPNISVYGIDEDYIMVSGDNISRGRNFTMRDVHEAANVCIIGEEVAKKLFGTRENPLGNTVSVGAARYQVVGVLEDKGSSFTSSSRKVYIPLNNLSINFPRQNLHCTVTVLPHQAMLSAAAQAEAEGIFRQVRRLRSIDENDFRIETSDNMTQMLMENLGFVSLAASVIGFITLIGAAVGLMNIMLVSVAERTREIGTRKALGARSAYIKQQFLTEAILICLMGGALGVLLGILAGNMVAFVVGGRFVMPWGWMFAGLVISTIVGLVSGYLPAVKASRLDPIVALRYE